MTQKQITRKFLKKADALSTRELVFFDEYINSVACRGVFPPVRHISNCVEALFQALPAKTLQTLQKNRPTHFSVLFSTLDMLLHPGQWSITRVDGDVCVDTEIEKPSRKLRRKK